MPPTTDWSVYVEYDTTLPDNDDVHDALLDQLADHHPALTTAPNGNIGVLITITAPTVEQACTTALETVGTALRTVHGSAALAGIEIMTSAELNRRNHLPTIPPLTDIPGVARILGISGAGARKRVTSPEFQRHVPVATTIDDRPYFVVEHVERYAAQRTPGRPAKATRQ
ncbi:hypothetical protein ABTX81_30755 [Kitasatospora sp. NPDC097605]|uniref:hypothetical protein n=1 Tax=Kitasatospora sp. NPDC097605 TaxID=3157226 RepID=UPI0033318FE5